MIMASSNHVLEVDGAMWDLSNLHVSFNLSECKRLYPRMLSDEEDLHLELQKKRTDDVPGATFKRKTAPPAHMTLKTRQQEKPAAEYVQNREQNQFRSNEDYEDLLRGHSASLRRGSARRPTHESDESSDCFSDEEEKLMLEVAPGMEVVLRGSAETRRAIKRWEIIRVSCLECTVELHCIEDAEYLLCPLCRCVSPLAVVGHDLKMGAYGVGLGFQSCPKSRRRRRREEPNPYQPLIG